MKCYRCGHRGVNSKLIDAFVIVDTQIYMFVIPLKDLHFVNTLCVCCGQNQLSRRGLYHVWQSPLKILWRVWGLHQLRIPGVSCMCYGRWVDEMVVWLTISPILRHCLTPRGLWIHLSDRQSMQIGVSCVQIQAISSMQCSWWKTT